jgi:hypothetical protein
VNGRKCDIGTLGVVRPDGSSEALSRYWAAGVGRQVDEQLCDFAPRWGLRPARHFEGAEHAHNHVNVPRWSGGHSRSRRPRLACSLPKVVGWQ